MFFEVIHQIWRWHGPKNRWFEPNFTQNYLAGRSYQIPQICFVCLFICFLLCVCVMGGGGAYFDLCCHTWRNTHVYVGCFSLVIKRNDIIQHIYVGWQYRLCALSRCDMMWKYKMKHNSYSRFRTHVDTTCIHYITKLYQSNYKRVPTGLSMAYATKFYTQLNHCIRVQYKLKKNISILSCNITFLL